MDEKVTKKSKATKKKSGSSKTTSSTTRDEKGRFIPGTSGNPGGRPKLSADFENYAKLAPDELWKIVQDEETSRTLKASILEWFSEMYYGTARQQVDVDAEQTINGGAMEVEFKGDLARWAK